MPPLNREIMIAVGRGEKEEDVKGGGRNGGFSRSSKKGKSTLALQALLTLSPTVTLNKNSALGQKRKWNYCEKLCYCCI